MINNAWEIFWGWGWGWRVYDEAAWLKKSRFLDFLILYQKFILKLINSERGTLWAHKACMSQAPYLRKFGNLSIRTIGQPMWNVKLLASVGACSLCLTWQWTSKQGICLPEPHDHITGRLRYQPIKVMCVFLIFCWPVISFQLIAGWSLCFSLP